MREIKFRGKNLDNEGWVYGSLLCYPNGATSIVNEDSLKTRYVLYHVDKDTVGQYTGLKDKNGKEIYEGDIVKYTRYNIRDEYYKADFSELIYQVYWNDDKHAFYCSTKFESGGGGSGYLIFRDERAKEEYIEVIGNVYDNPELLKGVNK